ncbi:MAG: bifunctional phosphopantothenoylcysteine decarboxylase/phosphopantothenate--cysteine ligase CoaBC [Sutterellaceae bacterium]|nr:bifunctional phosphopantothenoylcysteine decarboxylase/phosphopantothenate--cysteine ligase CoaBC [Sutterellaceae bacterium]MDD7441445.1 bifunctional phosphopantothenoylcysteine decarboxylase/phosphopantothenate--cysteine ligase CoaBC [Sutterellaceae bacterium]MDY2868757.1 bifunctional phosphopantothenoylcysteine decarboxylase/phosphopantothenate--cysteine ligase CoaBC [Mesosutterella sp.]
MQGKKLEGKRIVLAVTGGIAAYKSCELVRLLARDGADVRVAMTEAAARFVSPLTFTALSGHPAAVSEWGSEADPMPHITLAKACDLLLVAPATADILAKAANGIGDDLVSSLILARRTPFAVVPAMNTWMWRNPATQRNVRTLRSDGAEVWGPAAGGLACGDSGEGRMIEPEEIAVQVRSLLHAKPLLGKRVLVTAGPTYEPLDPVRGITNRSSGRQGYAIAGEAALQGAEVTLVSGPTALPVPFGVERVDVITAEDMRREVMRRARACDAFISVAAVCDWKPSAPAVQKMKKTEGSPRIEFVQNPDILAEVAGLPAPDRPYTVGFAAETERIEEYGREKLLRKGADLVAANDARAAIGSGSTSLSLISREGVVRTGPVTKEEASEAILRKVAEALS